MHSYQQLKYLPNLGTRLHPWSFQKRPMKGPGEGRGAGARPPSRWLPALWALSGFAGCACPRTTWGEEAVSLFLSAHSREGGGPQGGLNFQAVDRKGAPVEGRITASPGARAVSPATPSLGFNH